MKTYAAGAYKVENDGEVVQFTIRINRRSFAGIEDKERKSEIARKFFNHALDTWHKELDKQDS